MNLDQEIKLALDVAKKAGMFLSKHRLKLNETIYSKNKDIKLMADIETEVFIKDLIGMESNFPILGEESGASEKVLGDIYWVIDPLDGTANFSRNIPLSCVSIALMQKNIPILGVIYDFHNDELYSGSISHRAKMNDHFIAVSKTLNKEIGILATGLPAQTDYSSKRLEKMITDFQSWKKVRMIGSAAISSIYVASGKVDMYKEYGIYLWDIAAGAAIVNASGGEISITNMKKNYQVDAFFSNPNLKNEHN